MAEKKSQQVDGDAAGECIFCRIVAGTAEAHRVYENEHAVVILDINPWQPAHCLVISRRHVPWWHDLTEEETASVFNAARLVARRIMKEFEPEFVFLYGRGRRVPHTHIFLIPSHPDDMLDKVFRALEKIQETGWELADLRERSNLEDVAGRLRDLDDI